MTTIASPSLPLASAIAALRRSWLAALFEAVICALAALLLGADAIDPAAGVKV